MVRGAEPTTAPGSIVKVMMVEQVGLQVEVEREAFTPVERPETLQATD
jgi:hypothetical protein